MKHWQGCYKTYKKQKLINVIRCFYFGYIKDIRIETLSPNFCLLLSSKCSIWPSSTLLTDNIKPYSKDLRSTDGQLRVLLLYYLQTNRRTKVISLSLLLLPWPRKREWDVLRPRWSVWFADSNTAIRVVNHCFFFLFIDITSFAEGSPF